MSSLVLKGCLSQSFYEILADSTIDIMENKYKASSIVVSNTGHLKHIADRISIQDIYKQLAESIGIQLLDYMGLKKAVMLEAFHSIRRVSDQNRHVTGLHYDFQVSNAVVNSLNETGQSVTVWIPMKSITSDDAGLIVFDNDITLLDIHKAAGEEGYLSNIPYASASADNKRVLGNQKYNKYNRSEDALHIVDILNDFECDEESLDEFYKLYKNCLKKLYRNLKGRYYVTEMEIGDVLLFDSACYHGTYIPGDTFEPRVSLDLRVVTPFAWNEETNIFSGVTIVKT